MPETFLLTKVSVAEARLTLLMRYKSREANLMRKTWRLTVAGILTICGGIPGIIFDRTIVATGETWPLIPAMAAIGDGLIALGAVAVVGGVCALKKRMWELALAGAICALFPLVVTPVGVLAIIFVSLGKKEFA